MSVLIPRNPCRGWVPVAALLAAALFLPACRVEPGDAKAERARVADAGAPFEKPLEKRELPELPDRPDWRDLLQRAFLANGEIEAAYFEWRAAVARMDIAAAYPNTRVNLGLDYMFSKERLSAWDRTTLSAGFDPAMMLQWPGKVKQAAQVALDDSRAKAERFRAAKFAVQQRVLSTWLDYALGRERLAIEGENLELLKMIASIAAQRVAAGAPQQDLLKAQSDVDLAQDRLATLRSEYDALRAALNGMLARPASAPLPAPDPLPAARAMPDDSAVLAVGVEGSPELAALARQAQGRADAIELARMEYIPDFAPQLSVTGSIAQSVGTMVSLPTNFLKIRGAVDEARAMLRSTEAMARQTRSDRAASFVAALYALRNHERQAALLREAVLPKARQMIAAATRAYSSGSLAFGDLVGSQRALLDARLLLAEALVAREKRLAEIEALAGVDAEAFSRAATQPATAPQTQPSTRPSP